MKKLFFVLFVVLLLQINQQADAVVKLEELETVVTNKRNSFTFIGLNESQMYIVVFSDHFESIDNITFTSSGFKYKFDVFIPNDNDTSMTLSLYQYDSSTGQNSSSVLYSVSLYLIKPSDIVDINVIIDNLVFIVPIVIIALFILVLSKAIKF